MASVTLSSKYQIVIPRTIRDELALEAGQRFRILSKGSTVELVPVRTADQLRGAMAGAETTDYRDRSDPI
jgi:AbrB family looped-hinge helix DNA binding protein